MPAESTLTADGRPTRVLRAGAGSPLVWLHDSPGNLWSDAHSELSESHSVIAPSMPGFDDSSTLSGIDGPEDVVFWLIDVFAQLGLERAPVLGCGLGGWIAAEFAVRYPALVSKLVLVDAYGLRVPGALPADEFALTAPMLRPLVYANDVTPDLHASQDVEATLHARVAAARLAWQFPYDPKLRSRLRRADMPALVLWGERDGLVPPAHAHAYAEALPNAQLRIIPGVAHYPYLENAPAFIREVQAFLGN